MIRRYFDYFLARIKNGLDPLNNIAADFTNDEASKLYQMMSQTVKSASTPSAMREYIKRNYCYSKSSKIYYSPSFKEQYDRCYYYAAKIGRRISL